MTYPGGTSNQLGYDTRGNVTSRTLRDGQVLNYTYDLLNRRVLDDNPDTNVAEKDVTYAYDNLGRVLNASDTNGWFKAYEYDALGRATRERSNVGDNHLGYDLTTRQTRQTWGDGFYVTYDYDAAGAVTTVRENGSALLASYVYDDLGQRKTLTRGNGVVTSYTFDAGSRLMNLGYDLAGTAQDQTVTFGYNAAGQITSRLSNNDAYAWTGATNATRGYTPNALNQYTSVGGVSQGYDARGNLTNTGSATYQYNTRNQLYLNGSGQLIYRNPAGELAQVPGTNIDWVAGQLATEAGSSAIQRRYVYGPGVDEVLVWYEGAGTADKRWLVADERGSVIAVTNASGTVTTINTYDEHGIPGARNVGRFGYTGQAWVAELGSWDYKARMYSPTLGRFMQTDPIGYRDGMNWYSYAHGDAVNWTDPSGLDGATVPDPDDVVVTARRLKQRTINGDLGGGGGLGIVGLTPLRGLPSAPSGGGSLPNEVTATAAVNCKLHPTDSRCAGMQTVGLAQNTIVIDPGLLPYPRSPNTQNPEQQPNGCTNVPNASPISCDSHDVCYGLVGMSKEVCDYQLHENMREENQTWIGRLAADLYYFGVSAFGRHFYNDAQARSGRYPQ